ncbi:MAG: multidrug effflux MFS transporter [Alphaproteobacteria bacterium]|nr:multidrug effflux MFS transporter [Rhodospirillales bacterium]MCW9044984.1 multidrug effflux MFS transporter [Alphaproteobacteria bacterium]
MSSSVPLIIPIVLVAASAASVFSTDLYTPSLPHLPEYFGTTASMVQLSMSLNLAAFAFAQLIHGPLADGFGRRGVILWGMILFILASVGCALSESISSLIFFRIMQGLTISAEAVVVMVVIRDLWDEVAGAKVMAAYGMSISMAPAIGPIIGGYIHVTWGWQANFWLLVGLACLCTVGLWRYLPETGVPDRAALKPRRVLADFAALMANRTYMGYTVLAGMVMCGLFAYITEGPFLLIKRHGVPTEQFGYYQAAIVAAYFCGSLFANRVMTRFGIEKVLRLGITCELVGGAGFLVLVWTGFETPYTLSGAMSFFAFGLGLVFSTAPMRALTVAKAGRGSAAALLGATEMGLGALGALAVGVLHDGTAAPVAYVLSGSAILGLLIYVMGIRKPSL